MPIALCIGHEWASSAPSGHRRRQLVAHPVVYQARTACQEATGSVSPRCFVAREGKGCRKSEGSPRQDYFSIGTGGFNALRACQSLAHHFYYCWLRFWVLGWPFLLLSNALRQLDKHRRSQSAIEGKPKALKAFVTFATCVCAWCGLLKGAPAPSFTFVAWYMPFTVAMLDDFVTVPVVNHLPVPHQRGRPCDRASVVPSLLDGLALSTTRFAVFEG